MAIIGLNDDDLLYRRASVKEFALASCAAFDGGWSLSGISRAGCYASPLYGTFFESLKLLTRKVIDYGEC